MYTTDMLKMFAKSDRNSALACVAVEAGMMYVSDGRIGLKVQDGSGLRDSIPDGYPLEALKNLISMSNDAKRWYALDKEAVVRLDIRHGEENVDGGGYYIGVNCTYRFILDRFDRPDFERVTRETLPRIFFGDAWYAAEICDRDYYDSERCLKAQYYLSPYVADRT